MATPLAESKEKYYLWLNIEQKKTNQISGAQLTPSLLTCKLMEETIPLRPFPWQRKVQHS